MEMIIGGAFQGKEEYARERYPEISFADGRSCTLEEALSSPGILHFEALIRRELQEENGSSLAELLIRENPEAVVVAQEVGCGVVPVDPFERRFREAVGRECTVLAAKSRRVTRVICGIGTVIKDG